MANLQLIEASKMIGTRDVYCLGVIEERFYNVQQRDIND